MDNIEINIPEISFKKDFTIIYKGKEEIKGKIYEKIEEIKTSKEDLLRKLRYFKHRRSEINEMSEIFIHDSYQVCLFKEFIESLETHKIEVNEQNYNEIAELSRKYQYEELEEELSTFARTRPDLQTILETAKIKELDSSREETLSKNLDICLQNQNFINLPLPVLSRILNSPKRVLQDHRHLIEFMKRLINKYKTCMKNEHENNNEDEKETEENLQLVLSSLDYAEMSNEEIEEFLKDEYVCSVFDFRHSKERIKTLVEENITYAKLYSELATRISTIEQQFSEYKRESEEKEKTMKTQINEMKEELESQKEINSKYHKINDEMQHYQLKQTNRIQELETRLQEHDDMKNKLAQQEQILSQYQKSNELLHKSLSEQEKTIKMIEEKLRIFSQISAEVEKYHIIKGTINIFEGLNKLDKQRSKYVLNTNGSRVLGENEYQNGTRITSLTQNFSITPKSLGTFFLHALIVDESGKTDEIISEPLQIKTSKFIFDYTGSVQSVRLNPGKYKLEVWGSSGGENNEQDQHGYIYTGYAGKGGYSAGILELSKETTLYVYVGGTSNSTNGGWNGGGSARLQSAAGGGSTDISLYGKEGSTEWNTNDHLYSRIIVAGGGGGSSSTKYAKWRGGSGGGSSGENSGENQAQGGTQTRGHSFGAGMPITDGENSAGGGGWYGGYGSGNGVWGRGGGGGSGFVYTSSTASNYPIGCMLDSSFYLSNSTTISGKDEFPTTSGTGTEKGHSGNGYAIIALQ